MFGFFRLGYLFYPWGFLVQLVALVHFFRRRPDGFWLWVIFFGGFLGEETHVAPLLAQTRTSLVSKGTGFAERIIR